jgi:hypothetical protein
MIKKLIEKRINVFVENVLSERKAEINERINKEVSLYERKRSVSQKNQRRKIETL